MDDIKCENSVKSVWDDDVYFDSVAGDSFHDVSIATYLYNMFKKEKHTDVVFSVSAETGSENIIISAHKLILSIFSPYFADMFNDPDQMDNIITLKKVDPAAFQTMLGFMYGVFPSLKTCKEALELYKVSEKFCVNYLKNVSCDEVKSIKPEVGNVLEVLEASLYMELPSVKEYCLRLIQNRTAEVFESVSSEDAKQISASIIREILNLRKFSLNSEYDLIEWIFSWAKKQFYGIHTYSSVREVLYEFLPKLHFVSLSGAEFAQFYKIHESFFDQEEAFKILMNIALPNSLPLPEWQNSEFNFRVYTA